MNTLPHGEKLHYFLRFSRPLQIFFLILSKFDDSLGYTRYLSGKSFYKRYGHEFIIFNLIALNKKMYYIIS